MSFCNSANCAYFVVCSNQLRKCSMLPGPHMCLQSVWSTLHKLAYILLTDMVHHKLKNSKLWTTLLCSSTALSTSKKGIPYDDCNHWYSLLVWFTSCKQSIFHMFSVWLRRTTHIQEWLGLCSSNIHHIRGLLGYCDVSILQLHDVWRHLYW